MRLFSLASVVGLAIAVAGCAESEESADTATADAAASSPDSAEPEDRSDQIYDPAKVIEVAIEMDPADWDFIRSQDRQFDGGLSCRTEPFPGSFDWRSANVTVLGEVIENVGIRKKGFIGSLDDDKPSLKLKFDKFVEGQHPFGMERMTLNNNKSDPSFVKQCLAYGLFAEAGVPSPRCNFAHVTLNGENLGLFTNVEPVKKRFLARHFDDNDGDLYEGTLSDFREQWMGTFEVKTSSTDPAKTWLVALKDALELPDDELEAAVGALVDLDRFFTVWAMEVMVFHGDGYANMANNYFVYGDPTSDRLHFIPWGVDSVFGHFSKNTPEGAPKDVFANSKLAWRLYRLLATRARYVAAMQAILDDVWDEAALATELDRMEALIAPLAVQDPLATGDGGGTGKDGTGGKDGKSDDGGPRLTAAIDAVRDFVNGRRAEVKPVLDDPPAWGFPQPVCDPSTGKSPVTEAKGSECTDGETFEKNGVTYLCVEGHWVEQR